MRPNTPGKPREREKRQWSVRPPDNRQTLRCSSPSHVGYSNACSFDKQLLMVHLIHEETSTSPTISSSIPVSCTISHSLPSATRGANAALVKEMSFALFCRLRAIGLRGLFTGTGWPGGAVQCLVLVKRYFSTLATKQVSPNSMFCMSDVTWPLFSTGAY